LTKAEVISMIAKKTGLDREEVSTSLETFWSTIKTVMADGENVYIRGFGSFIVKKRAAKLARIISENKSIMVEAHCVPSFRPAKEFVQKIKASPRAKKAADTRELERKRKTKKTK